MKKFLLGLVTGLLLAGLAALIIVFSLIRFGERRPEISDGSTLVLRLEGPIPERAPVEIPFPLFEAQQPSTVIQVWDSLRKAAADRRIKAVVLLPKNVLAGWGKLQEIRSNLMEFKKSGKPLMVFLKGPGTREYYLATAADQIYMSREDWLNMKGLRVEMIYLRKTLDKLGIQAEIEHVGRYKDAGDMLTRSSMSPETREVMNSILDGIYSHLIETVAAARRKTPDQVRRIIDEGPFLARQAKEKGLVDDLVFEDQFFESVKKKLGGGELKRVASSDYARVPVPAAEGRSRIAFIVGDGDILRGGSDGLMEDEGITSTGMVRMLRQVARDPSIKGVVLRVNSPGGDSIASDEILREAKLLSQKKATVISMSDVAASGGYYISMTGDPVVAYSSTITGSIGVLYGKINLRGLYEKLGIQKDILTRGRFADIDSDYQPLSEAGRKKVREGIEDIYRTFVGLVAEARKKKYEEIDALAQGRVWLGSQARDNALVDAIGGLDRALALVKERAKIPAAEKVRIVVYPPRKSIIDQLLSRPGEVSLESLIQLAVSRRAERLLGGVNPRVFAESGFLRVMPYSIAVK